MILELVWPYIPVLVVSLFWAVAMRPVLRLIHASTLTPGARSPRGTLARAAPRGGRGPA